MVRARRPHADPGPSLLPPPADPRAVVRRGRPRGFTLVELLTLTAASLVVGAILLAVLGPALTPRRCCGNRQLKDSTQIRGVVQALIVHAANDGGSYPLPSVLDPTDRTVPERGAAKDTTANILSFLVFNGYLSPEILVSPAERNTDGVQQDVDYAYKDPAAAARPADALWDPAFRGTPIDPLRPGAASCAANQSYAHLIPEGRRLRQWSDTYAAAEAVFGNRGPTYSPMDYAPSPLATGAGRWALTPDATGVGSNTLLIHGGRRTWEGNIGYNDGHVAFETAPAPAAATYARASGAARPVPTADNLFVNEADEDGGDLAPGACFRGTNAFLRPIADRSDPAWMTLWRD